MSVVAMKVTSLIQIILLVWVSMPSLIRFYLHEHGRSLLILIAPSPT